jgi:hypothetical protein
MASPFVAVRRNRVVGAAVLGATVVEGLAGCGGVSVVTDVEDLGVTAVEPVVPGKTELTGAGAVEAVVIGTIVVGVVAATEAGFDRAAQPANPHATAPTAKQQPGRGRPVARVGR